MKKVILYNCPEDISGIKRIVEFLSLCKGIEEYFTVFQMNFINSDILRVLEQFPYVCQLKVNKKKLSEEHHRLLILERGFELSDYIIYVDGVLLQNDALEFYEYCRRYEHDSSVCVHSGFSLNIEGNSSQIVRDHEDTMLPYTFSIFKKEFLLLDDEYCLFTGDIKKSIISPYVSRAIFLDRNIPLIPREEDFLE